MGARSEFFAGVRAELPLLAGALPFGLIYGFLAREAGIPPAAAIAMSSIVFAGSAQFIGTQLFSVGAPWSILLLTTFVVNLRHVLYSAFVAPYLQHLRPGWKWLLGYLLTDEAYAVVIKRPNSHMFFLGAGLALWIGWQVTSALGVLLGARIPPEWNLEFALPLIFIAITVPMLTDRAARMAALVASVIAVVAWAAPMRLGLIAGALAGILAGILTEQFTGRRV